jgi:hypothetical protein
MAPRPLPKLFVKTHHDRSSHSAFTGQAGLVVPELKETRERSAVHGLEALAIVVERDRRGGAHGEELLEAGEELLVGGDDRGLSPMTKGDAGPSH